MALAGMTAKRIKLFNDLLEHDTRFVALDRHPHYTTFSTYSKTFSFRFLAEWCRTPVFKLAVLAVGNPAQEKPTRPEKCLARIVSSRHNPLPQTSKGTEGRDRGKQLLAR